MRKVGGYNVKDSFKLYEHMYYIAKSIRTPVQISDSSALKW